MKTLFLMVALALVSVTATYAQPSFITNTQPLAIPAPDQPTVPAGGIVVTNAEQAIAALVHFVCPNIPISQSFQLIAGIFVLARCLRKGLPDNLQTGKLGQLLAHAALEVNPNLNKQLADGAAQPAAKTTNEQKEN